MFDEMPETATPTHTSTTLPTNTETMKTETIKTSTTPFPPVPKASLISAPAFAAMHLQHTLAHAPDGVLFPFLHGFEGENEAQNMFFAGSHSPSNVNSHGREQREREAMVARVSRFEAWWVVAEEDALSSFHPRIDPCFLHLPRGEDTGVQRLRVRRRKRRRRGSI
ncbi:hypothetical protein C8R45DRAFT_1087724 [Mycena sanguinolenta]|nr:hypothetical protein C8R45DRAFT_1087724 [Mycena sanguinolenta]